MSTGSDRNNFGGASLLSAILLCILFTTSALGVTGPGQKKAKPKKPAQPLVQLPSGPTGPVQPIPLDNIAAVPPQVTYQDNQLTIVAPNSTLADILRAVHKQTGAEIEVPSAPDRVVTRLGPGPARDVMADLLNGSRFNYILLGSPEDANVLSRVVLVAKSGAEVAVTANMSPSEPRPQPNGLPAQIVASPMPEESPEGNENEAQEQEDNNAESAGEDNGDQAAAEAEQQQNQQPDQQGVKTPQQMLQEMQQRQMQLQQQQPAGQPPIPGSGMPPHPPQQN